MRESAVSRSTSLRLAPRNSPLLSVSHAKPQGWPRRAGGATERRIESLFCGSSAVSVRVPGVTMREILRSSIPLPGVPCCSTTTTDSPRRTRRAMYWSSVMKGTPAIGMGFPSGSLPRFVSVMPIRRLARTASSKKVS